MPESPDAADSSGWKQSLPFLLAAGIVAVLIVGWLIFRVVNPAEEHLDPQHKIVKAINDYYTAKNALDYSRLRSSTCPADVDSAAFPSEASFGADGKKQRDANGKIQIDQISDTVIKDATATAVIRWNYEKSKSENKTQTVRLAAQGSDWKVCGLP